MRCPYCFTGLDNQAEYERHVPYCAYRNNPLPDPDAEVGPEAVEVVEVDETGLGELNVEQLKDLARQMGLEGYSRLKRDELIELIEGQIEDVEE